VVPGESESQIAGDGRFVLLSVLAGVVFGALAWRLRSRRGPLPLALLAVAGVLSSVLARAVGELLSSGSARHLNAAFTPQLSLHSFAPLWVQAFFGVLVYTALAGLSSDPELDRAADREHRHEEHRDGVQQDGVHSDGVHSDGVHSDGVHLDGVHQGEPDGRSPAGAHPSENSGQPGTAS
jgi:hypothetical protein